MDLKKNWFFKLIIVAGVILFGLITFIILKSTSTTTAVVPNQEIYSGTLITGDMLKTITIPSNTPKGYITDKDSLIGQKLRVTVEEDQLLYINDVMSSWEELLGDVEIPDNYVITSMLVPSERAVGGLLTSGDVVDVLGLPNNQYRQVTPDVMQTYLGDVALYDSYGAAGLNAYWVLANVEILQTDSTLSAQENSSISTVTGSDDSNRVNGSYYIVALSYADYLKLRLCEQYLNIWLCLAPSQNEENDPLYDEMRQGQIKMMQDAQNQGDEYLKYQFQMDPNEPLHYIDSSLYQDPEYYPGYVPGVTPSKKEWMEMQGVEVKEEAKPVLQIDEEGNYYYIDPETGEAVYTDAMGNPLEALPQAEGENKAKADANAEGEEGEKPKEGN